MLAALVTGGVAMGGGLLTVAWRLGRMEQATKDLQRDVKALQRFVWRNGRAS